MIAAERQATPGVDEPTLSIVPRLVRRKTSPLTIKLFAAFLMVTVFVTVDGGWLFDTGTGLVVQSRAAALHAYWALMRAEGAPGEELAQLEEEWAQTQETVVLGAAAAFWWPGASAVVNRWQAETEAIWNRSLARSRESALAANRTLAQTLGRGPVLESR